MLNFFRALVRYRIHWPLIHLKYTNYIGIAHCSKSSFFCPKIQLWYPEKNLPIVLGENSWKCCSFGVFKLLTTLISREKLSKKFGWKTRENVGVCQNWIFGQKFDFSNSVCLGKFPKCKVPCRQNYWRVKMQRKIRQKINWLEGSYRIKLDTS